MKKRIAITLFILSLLGSALFVFYQLNQETIKAKNGTVIKAGDFRLNVENKWDKTAEKNYAELEWEQIKDLTQEGYRLFQSADSGSTWEARSNKYGKKVTVLNIYPNHVNSDSFDGWMKSLKLKDDNGDELITVTAVSQKEFNKNPSTSLKNKNGEWKYDVIMIGSWDANNNVTMEEVPAKYIKEFIDSGRGVLFGHDTVTGNLTTNTYFKQFAENLGVSWTYPGIGTRWTGSTKIQLINNGYLMKYPFEMQDNVILTIPYAHNIELQNKKVGTVWLEFIKPSGNWPNKIYEDGDYRGGWYLKTNGNVGMIQTGHSNGASTLDERKIIANTLYNLAQVSMDSTSDDQSVTDDVLPEKPILTNNGGSFDNFKIGIDSLDQGKKYQWYVEANSKSKGVLKSDVIEEAITSNIAGYFYKIDETATTNLIQEVESYKDSYGRIPKDKYHLYVAPLESTAVTYKTQSEITGFNGATDANKYLHVVSVDRANNVSKVSTIQIKDLMTEFQVIEIYSDDFGNKLQPDKQVMIEKNQDYSKTFPSIADYLINNYQIDTNPSIEATDETIVTISKLTDNHIVNYVYTKPVKLHARQVILEKNGSIAVPKNGKIEVWNTRDELGTDASSKLNYSVNSGTDEVAFFNIETKKKIGYHFLHLKPHVPSLYQYMGSVVTNSNTPHNVVDKTINPTVLSLKDGSEYWITIYMEPLIDTGVYLNVVNHHLNVYYSNISSFTVYIDGEKYQDFSVTNKPTVESKVLDIPISEIRNKISVKYLNSDGDIVTVYWNNNWDFVEDYSEG